MIAFSTYVHSLFVMLIKGVKVEKPEKHYSDYLNRYKFKNVL